MASADFSPIAFHTPMENPCTPNRPCEEEAPLLPPRTSTPYSYLRKKAPKTVSVPDDEPKALCGTVSSAGFLTTVIVLKLAALSIIAQMLLYKARVEREYTGRDLHEISVICIVAVPILLLALLAIRSRRSVFLLPYLLLQVASNFMFTVAVVNVLRDHVSFAFSQIEYIVPILTGLLVPYALWCYITCIALRQVFTMGSVQKLLKREKVKDVERLTTDEEEDVIVFERPRHTGRKVRFAGLLGRKEH